MFRCVWSNLVLVTCQPEWTVVARLTILVSKWNFWTACANPKAIFNENHSFQRCCLLIIKSCCVCVNRIYKQRKANIPVFISLHKIKKVASQTGGSRCQTLALAACVEVQISRDEMEAATFKSSPMLHFQVKAVRKCFFIGTLFFLPLSQKLCFHYPARFHWHRDQHDNSSWVYKSQKSWRVSNVSNNISWKCKTGSCEERILSRVEEQQN